MLCWFRWVFFPCSTQSLLPHIVTIHHGKLTEKHIFVIMWPTMKWDLQGLKLLCITHRDIHTLSLSLTLNLNFEFKVALIIIESKCTLVSLSNSLIVYKLPKQRCSFWVHCIPCVWFGGTLRTCTIVPECLMATFQKMDYCGSLAKFLGWKPWLMQSPPPVWNFVYLLQT